MHFWRNSRRSSMWEARVGHRLQPEGDAGLKASTTGFAGAIDDDDIDPG
jgi:hypothetical protein